MPRSAPGSRSCRREDRNYLLTLRRSKPAGNLSSTPDSQHDSCETYGDSRHAPTVEDISSDRSGCAFGADFCANQRELGDVHGSVRSVRCVRDLRGVIGARRGSYGSVGPTCRLLCAVLSVARRQHAARHAPCDVCQAVCPRAACRMVRRRQQPVGFPYRFSGASARAAVPVLIQAFATGGFHPRGH